MERRRLEEARNDWEDKDRTYSHDEHSGRFIEIDKSGRSLANAVREKTRVMRNSKTGRIERAISSASERTGAFKKR